jgi:predicted dehydrogenase
MKIGIIGVGRWGKNLVRNFDSIADCEIVWLCDSSPIDEVEGVDYVGPTTRDYHEVLADPSVDAVAIATPIPTHYQLALDSISAGKHVFSEKPLSVNIGEAEELTSAAAQSDRILFVDYLMRYSAEVGVVAQAITQGRIGEVRSATFIRSHVPRIGEYPDVIADLLPHDLSIMEKWFDGMPSSVRARKENETASRAQSEPASALLDFRYTSGIAVDVQLSRVGDARQRSVEVVGDSGVVLWDEGDGTIKISRPMGTGPDEMLTYESRPPLLSACAAFVDQIGASTRAVDALPVRTAAIFDAIDSGSKERDWVDIRGTG